MKTISKEGNNDNVEGKHTSDMSKNLYGQQLHPNKPPDALKNQNYQPLSISQQKPSVYQNPKMKDHPSSPSQSWNQQNVPNYQPLLMLQQKPNVYQNPKMKALPGRNGNL